MVAKKRTRVTLMGDYQDEIGATREKPMEQTAGQRIAAEFARPESHRELVVCAAAIDEAIADAREDEGQLAANKIQVLQDRLPVVIKEFAAEKERADSNWTSLERIKEKYSECHNELKAANEQLAAKEADCAAMRSALTQLLPYFKSLSQFERESKALHDAWNAAIIRTAGTDQSDTAPDAVMAGFIEQALASNAGEALLARLNRTEMKLAQREEFITNGQVGIIQYVNESIDKQAASQEALLARLRAAEKARDEHTAYIQHVLNPQLEAAADAIADVMALIGGSDEWDGVPATIRLIGARLRAAEEDLEHERKNAAWEADRAQNALDELAACSRRERAAEEKAAALDWLQEQVVNVIDLDDGRIIDVRGNSVLATIQAARAKEPSDA